MRGYDCSKAEPVRGDAAIPQSDLDLDDSSKKKLLVKRIIGLPGEEIFIIDEQLYINGKAYAEDYLKDGFTPASEIPLEGESVIVPDGMYYCIGDNRVDSLDSRDSTVGFIAKDMIKGRVVPRLFPFNKISTF